MRVVAWLAAAVAVGSAAVACSSATRVRVGVDGSFPFPADGPVYSLGFDDGGDEGEAAAETGPSASAFVTLGDVSLGNVGCGSSSTADVVIYNMGSAQLMVSASVVGDGFSVSPTTLSIGPGDQMGTLTVAGSVPSSATAGNRMAGTLMLSTNDPDRPSLSVPMDMTPQGSTLVSQTGSTALTFPTSEVDAPAAPQFIILTNKGNAAASVVVSAPSNPLFSLDGVPEAGTIQLNPGDLWTGTANFQAQDTTVQNATSTVTVSGTTCGTSVSAITYAAQGGYGALTGWPTAPLDFGFSDCGGTAPAAKTAHLINSTEVDTRIAAVSITPASSGFTTDLEVGHSIHAGGAYTFHVQAPAVPAGAPLALISATLSVTVEGETSPHTITLQQEPRGAVLSFDTAATPNFGSFGRVVLLTSAAQAFSVTNSGNATAYVALSPGTPAPPPDGGLAGDDGGASGDAASGDDGGADSDGSSGWDATTDSGGDAGPWPASAFSVANTGFWLDPGATQSDSVTFAPFTGRSFVDQVTLVATGPVCSDAPAPLPLTGLGVGGGLSISPSSLSFAATCGGGAPPRGTLLLTNNGPANLTWAMSPVTGPGAAQYTITGNVPGLLQAGRVAQIDVLAAAVPSPVANPDPAAFAAQITITTDVPLDPPHVIPLGETPIGDRLSFSVQSLRFGQFPIDRMTPLQSFSVRNDANPGSPAASVNLVVSGGSGIVYVEPLEGGAVCVATDGGEGGAGTCPVVTAGDGGGDADAGDGGDASDAADDGDAAPPEGIVSGYLLAPGGATTVPVGGESDVQNVAFVPTAAAPYPASIAIQTTDPLCSLLPAALQLSGSGTEGSVSLSGTTLSFGTDPADPQGLVNCGSTGLVRTLSVSNTGNQPFNVTSLALGKGSSSPYAVQSGAALPATVPIGGTLLITVTPAAIPSTVANPADPSPFLDTLTISTDAAFDSPHAVALVMQARGAIIADVPLHTSWDFGTVSPGSIGNFFAAIKNVGNAPASVTLQGLSNPAIFGLRSAPTLAAAAATTALVGQFVPPAASGSWTDSGTLVITAPDAFCQPLPTAWSRPAISFSGSSDATPPITIDGDLAFPPTSCGSAPPASRAVMINNSSDQDYAYTFAASSGVFYSISDSGNGVVAAGGTASIVVTPNTILPGAGVQTGSGPYADSLIIHAAPAAGDAGSASALAVTVPISWTLNGAVFSLAQGAGPRTDTAGHAYYPADTSSGYSIAIANGGNTAASVQVVPANSFAVSPATSTSVPAGGVVAVGLTAASSDASCPASVTGSATFLYSGPVCQPLSFSQVTVHACSGAF
jgi:hypothetical protein